MQLPFIVNIFDWQKLAIIAGIIQRGDEFEGRS